MRLCSVLCLGEDGVSTRSRPAPGSSTGSAASTKHVRQKQTPFQIKEVFGGGPISADRGRPLDRISKQGETKKGRAASSGGVTWGHKINNSVLKGRAAPPCSNGGSRDSLQHPSQSLQKSLCNQTHMSNPSSKLRWVLIGVAAAALLLIGVAVTTSMRPPRLSEPVAELLHSISEAESNGVLTSAPLSVAVAMKQQLIEQQAQLQENLLRQQVLLQMKQYEEAAKAGAAATFGVGSSYMASLTVDAANQYLQLRRAQQKQRAASKRLMELAARVQVSANTDLNTYSESEKNNDNNSDGDKGGEGRRVGENDSADSLPSNVVLTSPTSRRLGETERQKVSSEYTELVEPQLIQEQEKQQHAVLPTQEGVDLSPENAGVESQDPLDNQQNGDQGSAWSSGFNSIISTASMNPADKDSIMELSRMMEDAFEEKRTAWGGLVEIFLRAEERLQTMLLQLLLQQQEYISQQKPRQKNLRQTLPEATASSPPLSPEMQWRQSAAAAGAAAALVRAALRKAQAVSHAATAQMHTERSLWLLQLHVVGEALNGKENVHDDLPSKDLSKTIENNSLEGQENKSQELPEGEPEDSAEASKEQDATASAYNRSITNGTRKPTAPDRWDFLDVFSSDDNNGDKPATEGSQNDNILIQRGSLHEVAKMLTLTANTLPPLTLSSLAALDQRAAELVATYKLQRGERALFHTDLQILTQLGQSQHLLPSFLGDMFVFADDGF